ncbi:uncharacterized protein B0I36DRAFT_98125 [Microdochium trichocladiopsis]|uniref:2EXR domain-containing protein n=1 Tax=Microdochium trichocladiopsis TaxID=1682393 RepID=A0A9P8YCV8_9PEZI|nr:uncharacterized protein B0I36DRAFT_98125 [Microdochium trichocladiopsis]KAH7035947.1 hypothetical protein B0I36DRAFT_98125 [Microdochium trichocladiopsis]
MLLLMAGLQPTRQSPPPAAPSCPSPPADDDDECSVGSHTHLRSESGSSLSSSLDVGHTFSLFPQLPPEIRLLIWSHALPPAGSGINFFNVHAFPLDHAGCNRSTSPPWLYLDLRRLSIFDTDDDVAQYDPSVWQARTALRATCTEARSVAAIPPDKQARVVLTRPKRGLYCRAGDDKLRRFTPYTEAQARGRPVEPTVSRTLLVHADDILTLSIENCSFNLPWEDTLDEDRVTNTLVSGGGPNHDLGGWGFDPQLTPLPVGIPSWRYCISMVRGARTHFQTLSEALSEAHHVTHGGALEDHDIGYGMLDVQTFKLGRDAAAKTISTHRESVAAGAGREQVQLHWDRFGDCYVPQPWTSSGAGRPWCYRLTKVLPEVNDLRGQYIRSALLQSPKRPALG